MTYRSNRQEGKIMLTQWLSVEKKKTIKHYVATFIFMTTWMGGPFIDTQPSFPLASTPEASATESELLPTHRIVLGTVKAIKDDFAEVSSGETGDITPRYLNLNRAREKGFTLKVGEKVAIAINPQNLVVDYHRAGLSGPHKIIRGQLMNPLVVGQEWAVIRANDGKVQPYPIRPLARSKMAGIPPETDAVFFIDESNKIADARYTKETIAKMEDERWAGSSAYNVYRQKEGVVVNISPTNKLTIAMSNQGKHEYDLWSFAEEKLKEISKGDRVTLLLDSDDKVVDIAKPEPRAPQG